MRWFSRAKPKIGDTRVRTKFLFLPRCFNGQHRWMEFAAISEEYHYDFPSMTPNKPNLYWVETGYAYPAGERMAERTHQ